MANWDRLASRGNVEDRRGIGGLAIGGGGIGLTGVVLVLLFNLLAPGSTSQNDLNSILNQLQTPTGQQQTLQPDEFKGEDSYEKFASTVLGSNNVVWRDIFASNNKTYTEPRLVLFRTYTQTGCGAASSEVGPFYCPIDSSIYLDETFFDELRTRLGAEGGDVAQAYVISHEVGHHAQNQLGIMDKVQNEQQSNRSQANQLSIQLELQADCFAGIWAHSVANLGIFEPGEIKEAIDAAEAVGDDHIQKTMGGRVNPETWTHGSSAQRVEWFNRGFSSGKASACNTF